VVPYHSCRPRASSFIPLHYCLVLQLPFLVHVEDLSMLCHSCGFQNLVITSLFSHASNSWFSHCLRNFRICFAHVVFLSHMGILHFESSRNFFWCPVSLVVLRGFVVISYGVTIVTCSFSIFIVVLGFSLSVLSLDFSIPWLSLCSKHFEDLPVPHCAYGSLGSSWSLLSHISNSWIIVASMVFKVPHVVVLMFWQCDLPFLSLEGSSSILLIFHRLLCPGIIVNCRTSCCSLLLRACPTLQLPLYCYVPEDLVAPCHSCGFQDLFITCYLTTLVICGSSWSS